MQEKQPPRLIGARVRAARECAGLTQDALAEVLHLKDRQSVSDIENGKRALRSDELLTLGKMLKRETDYFLNPFIVAGEAQFSWRASSTLSAEALDRFELRAGQWIGLYRWLKNRDGGTTSVLKRTLRISASSSFEDAQECAYSLAAELKLGEVPAEQLVQRVEEALDIPVLFIDPDIESGNGKEPSISGATCHLEDFTAILINLWESEARRNFDLAHELFHALTWDAMRPDHRESNTPQDRNSKRGKRIEQLADNFASALLMPKKTLESRNWADFSKAVIQKEAFELKVSPIALAWRLLNLNLLEQMAGPDWELGTLNSQACETSSYRPKLFSSGFAKMLQDSIESGSLSPRKASKVMNVNVFDILEEHGLSAPIQSGTPVAA